MRSIFGLHHIYHVVCRDKHGNLKWTEDFVNQNTTEGMTRVLTDAYKAGTGPTLYIGLVDNAGYTAYAVGDTAAKITETANPPTTNGWQEAGDYDEANRQEWVDGPISGTSTVSLSNSASAAVFTISATVTIRGCFLISNNTKGGTTGYLYGVGDFTGGSKSCSDDDTLTITVTVSLS